MKKITFIFTSIALMLFTISGMAQIHYENTSSSVQKNSSAIGYGSTASGEKSFASGITSIASGICSTTLGQFNEASGDYAVTIGCNLKATGMRSMIIGSGYSNSDQFKLKNSKLNSLMVGFLSQYPTLFVSTSPSYNKTGRIGIGNVTNPLAKLHLRADEGEEAAVFIEPHNWSGGDKAGIYFGNFHNSVFADSSSGIVYKTEHNHVFTGGDVYINDIEKGVIMKSPDGKCWRGTLDNNGSLNFVQLDACPDDTASNKIPEKTSSSVQVNVYPNPASDYLTVEIANTARKGLTVSLSDNNGAVIATQYIRTGKTEFYTGNIPSGVYYVRVQGNGINKVKKVVRVNN